jgi:hypothetical protein
MDGRDIIRPEKDGAVSDITRPAGSTGYVHYVDSIIPYRHRQIPGTTLDTRYHAAAAYAAALALTKGIGSGCAGGSSRGGGGGGFGMCLRPLAL